MMKWIRSLVLAGCLLAGAAAQPKADFIGCWLNQGDLLNEQQLGDLTAPIQQPQRLAVLVHGLGNSRQASGECYAELAPRLRAAYAKQGLDCCVVGLQWDSDVDLGVFNAADNYLAMVARARKVGHGPARQLLLRLQQQYPQTQIDVYAHSLGCEVTGAMVAPDAVYADDLPKSESYEPKQDLFFNLTMMAGCDLDFDAWAKSQIQVRQEKRRIGFLWLTMSPYVVGDRDKVLQLRQTVRGMASGSAFPRMTAAQYDTLFSQQAIAIDNEDIPADHAWVNYFNQARLTRAVPMAIYLADPKQPKPEEFQELDRLSKAPEQVEAIKPFLDSPHLNTGMYALWRMERLLCGGSQHMADGSLDDLARLLRSQPAKIKGLRPESKCQSVHRGLWPTPAQMTRAGAPDWD